jgi:hypothetical protein
MADVRIDQDQIGLLYAGRLQSLFDGLFPG